MIRVVGLRSPFSRGGGHEIQWRRAEERFEDVGTEVRHMNERSSATKLRCVLCWVLRVDRSVECDLGALKVMLSGKCVRIHQPENGELRFRVLRTDQPGSVAGTMVNGR